jgi:acyl-coenzyme A thioesterase 13
MDTAIPARFGPIARSSPLLDALGGFCSCGQGKALEIGLLVGDRHVNGRGLLHGGVTATLCDIGLGYLVGSAVETPQKLVTTSLSLDYLAPASIGEWVEVKVDSTDATGRLVFATGHAEVGDRIIARARAVFARTG